MTCPHTNWTLDADLRLDGGCIQCWKERCEKAEACCAEMRSVLGAIDSVLPCSETKHALSSSCGQGYLSPDKARVLVEVLGMDKPWPLVDVIRRLIGSAQHLLNDHNCDCQGHEGIVICITEAQTASRKIEQALAQLKEAQ